MNQDIIYDIANSKLIVNKFNINELNKFIDEDVSIMEIYFDESIDGYIFPKKLKTIFFGEFNYPLDKVILPEQLEAIYFDYNNNNNIMYHTFEQSLVNVKFSNTIKLIHFGKHHDRPLDDVKFPDSLETTIFSYRFNQNIDKIKFPENLKTIKFGYYFNFYIDKAPWPKNLETIIFGRMFHKSLRKAKFPNTIKTISFDSEYKYVNKITFPDSLEKLTFNSGYGDTLDNLPNTLKELEIDEIYDDIKNLPHSIEKVKIINYNLETIKN